MTKGPRHEDYRALLGKFVSEICVELAIPHKCLGETTWKRPEVSRGLEADQCFYFLPEKLASLSAARARGSNNVADFPNPDLAIEIDLSPSLVDRASITLRSGSARSGGSTARLRPWSVSAPRDVISPSRRVCGFRFAPPTSCTGSLPLILRTNRSGRWPCASGCGTTWFLEHPLDGSPLRVSLERVTLAI